MKPVPWLSLVSELGARVLAPGVDLLLFVQSATLQLELGDIGTYSNFLGEVGGIRSGYLRWLCF
jgi:hypothetical protein